MPVDADANDRSAPKYKPAYIEPRAISRSRHRESTETGASSVESDPAHRVPMQAEVAWRSTNLLYVQPAMLGGAAAEAAARADPGQGPWHVVNYSKANGTAHLTTLGDGWAGVTYYLTGLNYLLEKTVEHQAGVRKVVFDQHPDFGQ